MSEKCPKCHESFMQPAKPPATGCIDYKLVRVCACCGWNELDDIRRQLAEALQEAAGLHETLRKIGDAMLPYLAAHIGVKLTEAIPMVLRELADAEAALYSLLWFAATVKARKEGAK